MRHEASESEGPTLPARSRKSVSAEFSAIEQACQLLAHCDSLPTVKDVRDRAEAFRHYAQSANAGLELLNKAAEFKLRAERRAGQLLAEMSLRGGDRASASHHRRKTLKQLNISQNQSARWQKAAEVPEEDFCRMLQLARENEVELSTAALLRLATAMRKPSGGSSICASLQLERPSVQQPTSSSPDDIVSELQNHCAILEGILSTIYNAPGPVDLHFAEKRYLRRLVNEFKSQLAELKESSVSSQVPEIR